ncbi:SRPBCC family protein [Pseudonocardia nigra]|uniref:SRPBCC family protein n=1 Tax=Pseudonocardia nigra TaxID=1921578 RepID=UPI001C5F819A|nr:SRPBCC domain-containing protein [Pseudonocardia nigra]
MSEVVRLRARAGAPVADVHRALTDAAQLRVWLAEHAEVDLPDRYAFWGRYTPEGDVPRQRPLHVDDRTVRFAWRIGGEDTTAEFRLEEEGAAATIVSLAQTHVPPWSEAAAEAGPRAVLFTFWSLAIANLVDHLEGRELTPKVDFTSPVMREQVVVAAPPDAVWRSLVTPAELRRWFGVTVDIEPHVGGRLAMGGFDAVAEPARIVDLEPGRSLTVDWGSMVSTWELEGTEGRTRLTFVQSGFDEQHPPYAGWLGGVAGLGRYHELADWQPIWLDLEPGVPSGVIATD